MSTEGQQEEFHELAMMFTRLGELFFPKMDVFDVYHGKSVDVIPVNSSVQERPMVVLAERLLCRLTDEERDELLSRYGYAEIEERGA